MDAKTAIAELGQPGRFPREALAWTQANWPAVSADAVALCTAVTEGRDESPEAENALFFLLHAGAAARATELHAPLCNLLLDPELAEQILNDGLTEHVSALLTATFDGDALTAMAWLAAEGHLPRDLVVAMLRRVHETLIPEEDALALSWAEAVAALQITELEGDARDLFATHIPRGVATLKEFLEDVSAVRRGVTPNPIFDRANAAPLEDAVAALETWRFEVPSEDAGPEPAGEGWIARDVGEPWMNPTRHVGRNDPCPCGSGKKYKKCCLPA
ncbi:MAG: SEC-C domain-containing protein [Rhodospirillales bacterium]|nr:SEC-C domain-containing protein [Rhodospirillales bacterium]